MTAHAADAARGFIGKMGGVDHGARIGPLVEQALARHAGECGILIGEEGRVGPYQLHRMVYDVAGKSGLQAATLRVDDDAAGRRGSGSLDPPWHRP